MRRVSPNLGRSGLHSYRLVPRAAVAFHGDDLLIATAKGEGTGTEQGNGQDCIRAQTSGASLYSDAAAGINRAVEHSLDSRQAR